MGELTRLLLFESALRIRLCPLDCLHQKHFDPVFLLRSTKMLRDLMMMMTSFPFLLLFSLRDLIATHILITIYVCSSLNSVRVDPSACLHVCTCSVKACYSLLLHCIIALDPFRW